MTVAGDACATAAIAFVKADQKTAHSSSSRTKRPEAFFALRLSAPAVLALPAGRSEPPQKISGRHDYWAQRPFRHHLRPVAGTPWAAESSTAGSLEPARSSRSPSCAGRRQ